MREVLPLAAAPDAAALKRARRSLEAARDRGRAPAGAGGRRVRAKTVRSGRSGKGSCASARCARCWKRGDAALHAQLFAPDSADADGGAQQRHDDRWRRDRGRRRRRARRSRCISSISPAAARRRRCSPARCCRLGKAASATLVESYIAADGAKVYQVHDLLVVCDRRRRAARPCAPDRGQPRGLQHFLVRR